MGFVPVQPRTAPAAADYTTTTTHKVKVESDPREPGPGAALSGSPLIWFTAAMRRTLAIVNPASGNGATARFWPKARRELEAAGAPVDAVLTEGPGHATSLARRAGGDGYEVVLYVGGDGTANEVTNGLMEVPAAARPALAALPRGTGGDFPASLAMAPGAEAAALRLLGDRTRRIDVAASSFTSLDGTQTRRYFLNIADAGIGGYVAERVNRTTKVFGGFASFLYATLATFWTMEKPYATVWVDGETVHRGPATSVAVCNGSRFGGGMLMAPEALPDDGLLDVVVIGDIGKIDLALNLPRLYRGTHLDHRKVHAFRGREVRVDTPAPAPLEIDGEHPGMTPFHVWIEPGALSVVV